MRTFLWTGYAASPGVGMMNWTPGQERKVFKMTQRRKRYDRQFKASAAKVVLSGEMTVKGLSEKLGIKDSTLRRWACEYEEMGDDAFPGNGSPKINKDYEIVKLKKKVEELERENEILKKFPGLLEPRPCVRFEFLKEHRGEIGPIKKACGLMKASKSGFSEYLLPEEVQRPDRARGARRVRRRGLPSAQEPLRLPAHQPQTAKKRHRREREARAPHHAEARACRKGRDAKTPHPEEGRAGRPSVEPGRARFLRGRAQQALGGRHRMHARERRVALSRSRDRRLLPQGRRPVDVRAHHREGRDRRDRAGGWKGGAMGRGTRPSGTSSSA